MNSETKACQNCKNNFTIEPDDFSFYEKMEVPAPTWCPECRLQRRMVWRNERTFYKRDCDSCGKASIMIYAPDAPFIVYCRECWWGDSWDSGSFGQEYDFSKTFFEQYRELMLKVPRLGMVGTMNINSDYANFSLSNRNVYLCYASHYNEDSAYLQYSNKCKQSYDCLHVSNSERVIDCNYSDRLYHSAHLMYANSCSDCILGYDLHNCNDCFGCVGLRQKSYCIFNQQYSKEEYHKKIALYLSNSISFSQAIAEFEKLRASFPRMYTYMRKSMDSNGNDLEECKNVRNSFSIKYSEDSKYLFVNATNCKQCMDMNNIAYDPTEIAYECQGMTNSSNMKFCDTSWNGDVFIEYGNLCFSSQHLFGCVGMRKKEYSILNRQYTKEEYETLVPKIKEHMNSMPFVDLKGRSFTYGEFFPIELAPFGYNETICATYYPRTKEDALAQGFTWRDEEPKNYTINCLPEDLPKEPSLYTNEVTKYIIGCEHVGKCADQCTTAFRILPDELELYQSLKIPLPTLCPNCRNIKRIRARGPFKLWHRQCMCDKKHTHHEGTCPNEFETSYAPDRPESIYCESCYQQEVI